MKYLITGGGTGGHIYPALAIANKIKSMDSNAEILYVGRKDSLESKLVPKHGFNFTSLRVNPLPRKINKQFFKSLIESFKGMNDSSRIINEFKPDIVIGTGGYVSGPLVLMASLKKVPSFIHEQNSYPGITNKILSLFVDKIGVTFEDAIDRFPNKKNIIVTGNPVRDSIRNIDKDKAYNELKVSKNKKLILSFGGSGGQRSLNNAINESLKYWPRDLQLIHITGERLYEEFNSKLEVKLSDDNIKIYPYLYSMPEALNVADLVITSAGAITLAEIATVGLPSILIPKSYTAENHQVYNAKFFEKELASKVILEEEVTSDRLMGIIESLIYDDKKLRFMSNNAKKLANKNALKDIYEIIRELTYRNH